MPQIIQARRARSEQEHELRRDKRAKQYEFALIEYKERRDACADLMAAAHHDRVVAGARLESEEAFNKLKALSPHLTPQITDALNEHKALVTGPLELANQARQRALHVLDTDQSAKEVVRLYKALPYAALLDDPHSKEVNKAWREGVIRLQDAIYAYLQVARVRLLGDDTDAGEV